jgi:hypothetical protein
MVRIHTNGTVKVIDRASPHFGDIGVVIGVRKKPAGMRIGNHLQVRLYGIDTHEIFLSEQLELIRRLPFSQQNSILHSSGCQS